MSRKVPATLSTSCQAIPVNDVIRAGVIDSSSQIPRSISPDSLYDSFCS